MLTMYEDLARARMREMEQDASEARRASRLLAARRWQRRAEAASHRARLARLSIR